MLNYLGKFDFYTQRDYSGTLYPAVVPYVLEFFYDDNLEDVFAFKDGFNIPFSIIPDKLYYFSEGTAYGWPTGEQFSFCDGSTKVSYVENLKTSVGQSWLEKPFFIKHSQPNHFSCADSEIFCDIVFKGDPIVSNATSSTANDASITVSATSSNPGVKYGIQTYFSSGTKNTTGVNYQTSNFFNNLFPGLYTIYAKDASGCIASTRVQVGYKEDDFTNTRIWFEFDSYTTNYRVNIVEKVDSSTTEEVKPAGTPVVVSTDVDDEIYKRVKGSEMQINLASEVDEEFLTLFNKPDKYYRADLIKDPLGDNLTIWSGFSASNQYQEDHKDVPYISSIVFNDGLGELKKTPYKTLSGETIKGRTSIFETLLICLRRTGIDFNVRISIDLQSKTQSISSTQTPMHVTFVDQEVYEGKSCYEVLESILANFNARISVKDGYFWVNRIYDNVRAFTYKEYDLQGIYQSSATVDNYKILRHPKNGVDDDFFVDQVPLLRLGTGKDYVSIKRPSYARESVIRNFNFEGEKIFGENGVDLGVISNWTPFLQGSTSTTITQIDSVDFVIDGLLDGDLLTNINKLERGFVFTGNKAQKKLESNKYISIKGNSNSSRIFSRPLGATSFYFDDYKLKFRFKVNNKYENIPFYRVKWRLSWGNFFLSKDGEWSTDNTPNIHYTTSVNDWSEVEIDVKNSFDTQGYGTTGALKIEIYTVDIYTDLESDSFTTTSSVSGYATDAQIIVKTSTLQNPAESDTSVIQYWKRNGDQWQSLGNGIERDLNWFGQFGSLSIDDVQFIILPNGNPPIDDFEVKYNNQERYYESYEETLINGTLPRRDANLPGIGVIVDPTFAKNRDRWMFDYFFKNSLGEPIYLWKRSGATTYNTLENITASEILDTYDSNYWILDATLFSKSSINLTTAIVNGIHPITSLGGDLYEGKLYLLGGFQWDVKRALYTVPMIEMGTAQFELNVTPSESNVDGENSKVVPPSEPDAVGATGEFNSAFSNSFEINSD